MGLQCLTLQSHGLHLIRLQQLALCLVRLVLLSLHFELYQLPFQRSMCWNLELSPPNDSWALRCAKEVLGQLRIYFRQAPLLPLLFHRRNQKRFPAPPALFGVEDEEHTSYHLLPWHHQFQD